MAKREEFKLKASWCQQALVTCLAGRASFPKKWGDKEIPIEEQLIAREDLGELFKTLRSYSSWLQDLDEDYRALFGDKDNWRPIDKTGARIDGVRKDDERIGGYEMVDSDKEYTLRLGKEALSGVVWCCILRLHPHCIIPTSTKDAVDVWWPVAEAIGKANAVRKYIGLAGAKRTEFEDDPDPSETKTPEKETK
jgi:hypothetical protein